MKSPLYIIIVLPIILFVSCIKVEEPATPDKTHLQNFSNIVSSGIWKITGYIGKDYNDNPLNYIDTIEKYFQSNTFRFKSVSYGNTASFDITFTSTPHTVKGCLTTDGEVVYLWLQSPYLIEKYYPETVVPTYAPLMLHSDRWLWNYSITAKNIIKLNCWHTSGCTFELTFEKQ